MQLFLHLYSTISGRISFNNNFFAILKEQTKTKVKINFEENFYLEFTPINYSTYSNFLCEIKYEQNNLKCNSDNISIIKLDEENYYIIKIAVEKYNGVITKTGRGSAPSFYINKLLGFTNIDRISAPIKLFPSRFMSVSRILRL